MGVATIVGPGHGGTAAAAQLSLAGHEIRVWARRAEVVELLSTSAIELRGQAGEGQAKVALATTDLAEAVRGADVVFVLVPGHAHAEVGAKLAGVLTDDQVVVLMPGSFGSFEVARALHAAGRDGVAVAETATLPYGARSRGTQSVVPVAAVRLPMGVFPAIRTDEVVELVSGFYPIVEARQTILDAGLLNPNVPIHTALMVTNAGPVESFDAYDIHAQGTTAATRRLIDHLDAERIAVRDALGYGLPHFEQATYYDPARRGEGLFGAAARDMVESSGAWKEPLSFSHRYLTEDAAKGLSLQVSLGEWAGVDVPASKAVLTLSEVLQGHPFNAPRTMDSLGLSHLDPDGLHRLLTEGW